MNIILYISLLLHAIWIIVFQTFGLVLLPRDKYYLYPLLCAIVSIHWIFFDNKCILSIFENTVADDKKANDDTRVYDYVETFTHVPVIKQKKFQHTMMTVSFLYVAYLYRKDVKIVALSLMCLYLNRWGVWSKNFS
jgi:hypothetical protein